MTFFSDIRHTGTVTETSIATFGLFFAGHNNFVSVTQHLVSTHALDAATEVLLSGDSAGGMGVFYNVDWLASTLPKATVKGAPVGGWYFPGFADDQPDDPWAPPSLYPEWTTNKTGATRAVVGYLVALYHVYIHPNCADKEAVRFHCGSVNVMYKHIKSPLFVLQNMYARSVHVVGTEYGSQSQQGVRFARYDSNQIISELFMPGCSGDACSQEQLGFVRYFGRAVRKSTHQVTCHSFRLVLESPYTE